MSSRIEQGINDIQQYIDECKLQPFSSTRIIVNKEEIDDLIERLRQNTPEEIKRYQKMISNKEAILADARTKADQIIARAQVQTTELISEHQIMQQAYAQAHEIVSMATNKAQAILDDATNEANSIRMGAMMYTEEKLRGLEELLVDSLDSSRLRYETLINSLQGYLDIVSANRAELIPQEDEFDEIPEQPIVMEQNEVLEEDDLEDDVDFTVVDVNAED